MNLEEDQTGAEEIRETTAEILSRPEFAEETPRPFLEDILERLAEWLDSFGEWVMENPVLGWSVMAVLMLILVAVIAHMVYVLLGDVWVKPATNVNVRKTATQWEILEGKGETWLQGMERARIALKAGDMRQAVWISHRVLLGLLDEQGAIRFARSKTNSDYLGECDRSHPWNQTLRHLTEFYERVIYGHRTIEEEALSPFLERIEGFARNKGHEN